MKKKYFPNTLDKKLPRIFYPVFIFSACLILAAGRGDLWLDEIWSLLLAEATSSTWEIMQIKHDNNHLLNTLYIYILGEQERFFLYRLLAMVSGIATIYLISLQARTWGKTESVIALLLAGTSYPLILYFSEARGYAPAIFFAISTFIVLQKYEEQKTPLRLIGIWLLISLGLLSHLTFIIFFLSIFIYSVSLLFIHNSRESLKSRISDLLLIYCIPFVFVAALYFFFIQHLTLGGGPVYNKIDVLYNIGSFILGLPAQNIVRISGFIFLLLSSVTAIISLYKSRDHLWIFFTGILFIVPALLILVTKPSYLYFRYFIICFPFYYLLLSYLFGRIYQAKLKSGTYAVVLIVTTLMVGHTFKILPLLKYGRGNYTNAMKYMLQNSTGQTVRIGSDHDFRNGMLLKYYSRFAPPERQIHFINKDNIVTQKPDWLITHNQDLTYNPPEQIIINNSLIYEFRKKFSYSGVSGWNWFIYKLADYAYPNP
ncbi:MAG: hypothetical protein JSW69_04525 [Deltaproteobacteria bacterium]|nr:MAG: hypothetical protein JSW69_04525 [Deltaproteobacteria bacterium]